MSLSYPCLIPVWSLTCYPTPLKPGARPWSLGSCISSFFFLVTSFLFLFILYLMLSFLAFWSWWNLFQCLCLLVLALSPLKACGFFSHSPSVHQSWMHVFLFSSVHLKFGFFSGILQLIPLTLTLVIKTSSFFLIPYRLFFPVLSLSFFLVLPIAGL